MAGKMVEFQVTRGSVMVEQPDDSRPDGVNRNRFFAYGSESEHGDTCMVSEAEADRLEAEGIGVRVGGKTRARAETTPSA